MIYLTNPSNLLKLTQFNYEILDNVFRKLSVNSYTHEIKIKLTYNTQINRVLETLHLFLFLTWTKLHLYKIASQPQQNFPSSWKLFSSFFIEKTEFLLIQLKDFGDETRAPLNLVYMSRKGDGVHSGSPFRTSSILAWHYEYIIIRTVRSTSRKAPSQSINHQITF